MDFSAGWKSGWTIGGVYPAPLLISGDSAKTLGPLLFSPDGPPTALLPFPVGPPRIPDPPSGPFLHDSLFAFQRSFHHFLPFSVLSSVARDDNDCLHRSSDRLSGNALRLLKCSNGVFLLLFLIGDNADEIGGLFLSGNDPDPRRRVRAEEDGSVFRLSRSYFGHRILQFAVTQTASSGWKSSSITEGFLFVCTSYTAHWYRIDIRDSRPNLVPLAYAKFGNHISYACWSPHIPEESAIILESGELRLFDLNLCLESLKGPSRLRGRVIWEDSGRFVCRDDSAISWWSCDFAWHPRIFIVACGIVVLLVDSRNNDAKLSVIAKIEWDHGVCNPRYVEIHRLSDLRPSNGRFKRASESGFVIMVGSFRSCEFGVFCYGSHPDIGATLDCLNPVYAWELPSELKIQDKECSCSMCIVQQTFPINGSDQDRLSGFCVITNEGNSPSNPESESEKPKDGDCEGFNLVKLWESGKLEYQNYKSSWNFSCTGVKASNSCNLISEREAGTDVVHVKFRHFNFQYLLKYLNGGSHLAELLDAKKQNFVSDGVFKSGIKQSHTEASTELLKRLLERAGLSVLGDRLVECGGENTNTSSPSLANALNKISMPASIYEAACTRLWTRLSMNLLQCAFFRYSDLCSGQNKQIPFLDVPFSSFMQLPPFYLRLPSANHERSASAVSSNALVGPVLPFPFLLAVHQMNKDMTSFTSDDTSDGSLVELEVDNQCEEILKACETQVSSETSQAVVEPSVSLSADKEVCFGSQELQGENSLFLHKPVGGFESHFNRTRNGNCSKGLGNRHDCRSSIDLTQSNNYGGKKFRGFVSRRSSHHALDGEEKDLLQQFDDLCPIKLSFSGSKLNTKPEGMKVCQSLMKQFSRWQDGFEPYKSYAP